MTHTHLHLHLLKAVNHNPPGLSIKSCSVSKRHDCDYKVGLLSAQQVLFLPVTEVT